MSRRSGSTGILDVSSLSVLLEGTSNTNSRDRSSFKAIEQILNDDKVLHKSLRDKVTRVDRNHQYSTIDMMDPDFLYNQTGCLCYRKEQEHHRRRKRSRKDVLPCSVQGLINNHTKEFVEACDVISWGKYRYVDEAYGTALQYATSFYNALFNDLCHHSFRGSCSIAIIILSIENVLTLLKTTTSVKLKPCLNQDEYSALVKCVLTSGLCNDAHAIISKICTRVSKFYLGLHLSHLISLQTANKVFRKPHRSSRKLISRSINSKSVGHAPFTNFSRDLKHKVEDIQNLRKKLSSSKRDIYELDKAIEGGVSWITLNHAPPKTLNSQRYCYRVSIDKLERIFQNRQQNKFLRSLDRWKALCVFYSSFQLIVLVRSLKSCYLLGRFLSRRVLQSVSPTFDRWTKAIVLSRNKMYIRKCIVIQTIFRCHISRLRHANEFVGARTIQLLYRLVCSKRRFAHIVEKRVKNQSATLLQSLVRRAQAVGHSHQMMIYRDAATVIQSVFRVIKARHNFFLRRKMNKAAILYQTSYRAFVAKRHSSDIRRAYLVLQKSCRGTLAKRYTSKLRQVQMEHTAARFFQTLWRQQLARERLQIVKDHRENACCRIQYVWRKHRYIQSDISALLIQRWFMKIIQNQKHVAACALQTLTRKSLFRKRFSLKKYQESVLSIQCAFRVSRAKDEVIKRRHSDDYISNNLIYCKHKQK